MNNANIYPHNSYVVFEKNYKPLSFRSSFLLQSIKDSQLFVINGALASVVLLVLVIWQMVSPYQVVVRMLDKEVWKNSKD